MDCQSAQEGTGRDVPPLHVTYMLHKPLRCLSARSDPAFQDGVFMGRGEERVERATIYTHTGRQGFPPFGHVGRLDYETSGARPTPTWLILCCKTPGSLPRVHPSSLQRALRGLGADGAACRPGRWRAQG